MVCDDKWHSIVSLLFFILDEVFSVNTTCCVKAKVNARIVATPLFQMICQFPKPCFCSLFIGADAFDSESLAVRNTVGAMLRMTTLWGQVLMCICRFVLYVSWHHTIFTGSVSIQIRDVISGCFMGEFYSGHSWHGQRNDWGFLPTRSTSCHCRLWNETWKLDCRVQTVWLVFFQVSPWRSWRMEVPSLFP